MYCPAQVNSLNIKPDGNISICCASQRDWHIGHISEVDDILNLWETNEDLIKIRNGDEELIEHLCGYCIRSAQAGARNSFYSRHQWNLKTDGKIRYLEFTTSNICNQTCVTCSSYYSSKWLPLEHSALEMSLPLDKWKTPGIGGFNDFDQPTYRMTDDDIEKILPLLPDLQRIDIKGGEPFADNNNFYIIKELLRVNPTCEISTTTNLSKLPQKYLDLFSKADNFIKPTVSMDGIGKTYEWVRSTPFEQTIENIKRWKLSVKNTTIGVNHRMNIFNMWNFQDTLNYWNENLGEYVHHFVQMGWVNEPKYSAATVMYTEQQLSRWLNTLDIPNHPRIILPNLYVFTNVNTYKPKDRTMWKHRSNLYAQFMNFTRGIDIFELHPELLESPYLLDG